MTTTWICRHTDHVDDENNMRYDENVPRPATVHEAYRDFQDAEKLTCPMSSYVRGDEDPESLRSAAERAWWIKWIKYDDSDEPEVPQAWMKDGDWNAWGPVTTEPIPFPYGDADGLKYVETLAVLAGAKP